jgi:uncharacterized membrane protein
LQESNQPEQLRNILLIIIVINEELSAWGNLFRTYQNGDPQAAPTCADGQAQTARFIDSGRTFCYVGIVLSAPIVLSFTEGHPMSLNFPRPFQHEHPPIADVNELFEQRQTRGQRAADRVAKIVGSWKFIIIQSCILVVWGCLNGVAWAFHWDPYPFILMNLFLSLQAAYTAPVIMMSQNRQAIKDRIESHHDFLINQKAEEEIRAVLEHLTAQDQALLEIHGLLGNLKNTR